MSARFITKQDAVVLRNSDTGWPVLQIDQPSPVGPVRYRFELTPDAALLLSQQLAAFAVSSHGMPLQVSLTDEAVERLAAAVRAGPKPEIIRTTKPLKGSRIRTVRRPEPPTHVYVVYKTPAGPVALRVFSVPGLAEAFAATASEVEGLYSDESTAADIALARKLAVPMVRGWHQPESAMIAPTG